MSIFKVGDLVIMQNATYYTEYDGTTAVITSPLDVREVVDTRNGEDRIIACYGVRLLSIPDALELYAQPHQVRRPKDDAEARALAHSEELETA
jgi:hypothetical protein